MLRCLWCWKFVWLNCVLLRLSWRRCVSSIMLLVMSCMCYKVVMLRFSWRLVGWRNVFVLLLRVVIVCSSGWLSCMFRISSGVSVLRY